MPANSASKMTPMNDEHDENDRVDAYVKAWFDRASDEPVQSASLRQLIEGLQDGSWPKKA